MTCPRSFDPGQTYLITRRCTGRRFLLRPDPVVNNLLLYLLSLAAERHGIELHAFAFLSNRYHLVLSETAPTVKLPEFMAWFNQHAAKLINAVRGERREGLWASGSYDAVVLADRGSVVEKIVDTVCKPVAAGLVEKPEDWGGLLSRPQSVEQGSISARHPRVYFRAEFPERTRLHLTRPPCFKGGLSAERFRSLITKRVADRVDEIRRQRNEPFLGMDAVLALDLDARPQREESSEGEKALVACEDPARRAEIVEALARFQSAYREAFQDWQAGRRSVVFPVGTYGMVRFHKARLAQGPGIFSLK